MKYTIISDTEMTEVNSFEMMGWKEEKVTREVKGDKMHVVSNTTINIRLQYHITRIDYILINSSAYTKCATCGAGTAYPSGAPESISH